MLISIEEQGMNSSNSKHWIIRIAVTLLSTAACAAAAEMPASKEYTNSIGMKLVRIEGGRRYCRCFGGGARLTV
jgi:hypothetical protein